MSLASSIVEWVRIKVFVERLNNPFGFLLIVGLTAFFGLAIGFLGIKMGVLLFAAIVGIPLMLWVFLDEKVGIATALVIGFTIQLSYKFGDYPMGTLLDGLTMFMVLAIFIKQIGKPDWSFAKSPISYYIIAWMVYSFIQILNPEAKSILAWVYTVRSMTLLILLYFVCCYAFSSLERIKWVLKFTIFLTLLSALYGLKQEWLGYTDWERVWLYSDPLRAELIVQWGRERVFSIFSDPTTFGILMAYMAVFCIVLAAGAFKTWQRVVLFLSAGAMILSMVYGGSRTPVVLIPAGFAFYVILTLRKEVIVATGIFFVLGAGLMMKGTSNPVILRIQSAFNPGEDASFEVREASQEFIKPFIQSHPFGAGMGTTGIWGKRFSPNTMLASFPPDSGYVRIAVEMGWIGLILYMVLLFKIQQQGVYYYVRVKDPQIKTIYLGLNVIVFLLIVASFPQEIIILLPTSIIFYISAAAIVRLKDYDPAFNEDIALAQATEEEKIEEATLAQ